VSAAPPPNWTKTKAGDPAAAMKRPMKVERMTTKKEKTCPAANKEHLCKSGGQRV
jgi:hypothetical protein